MKLIDKYPEVFGNVFKKQKLSIEIIEHYGTEDKKFTGECNTELKINDKTILSGDEYHNKITFQIKGFLECLKYLDIKYSLEQFRKADEPLWD